MIAPSMIRKLGKTYTDKQMTKDKRVVCQDGAWSNKEIAFREPLPKHIDLEYDDVVEKDGFWSDIEQTMNLRDCTVQVWPVELKPMGSSSMRIVRMSDGNGLSIWFDAGYISAILKRQPTATFHTNTGNAIVAKNSQPFAMVASMDKETAIPDSEWSITNDDLDAAREFDTANELAALLPARPGSKWHEVFYMGMMVEARRSGSKNKKRTLHVRMAGREATSHISLYDGRGV